MCDAGEYLDYENCECRKRLIDELVEECRENINGNEMVDNAILNDHEKVCKPCTVYLVLLVIAFLIILGISRAFFIFIGT